MLSAFHGPPSLIQCHVLLLTLMPSRNTVKSLYWPCLLYTLQSFYHFSFLKLSMLSGSFRHHSVRTLCVFVRIIVHNRFVFALPLSSMSSDVYPNLFFVNLDTRSH